jgi:uncharacterized cupredoxin-like copper-binding protein
VRFRATSAARKVVGWWIAAALLATVAGPAGSAVAHAVRDAPSIGYAHPLATTESATLYLTDAPSFQAKYLSVPEDSTLTLTLNNTGAYTHTFTLVNQSGVLLKSSWTPAQVYDFFVANGSADNTSVAPGTATTITLPIAPSAVPESFEFVSVVPYQFQAGMWGLLNVTPTGPGLLIQENTTNANGAVAYVPNLLSASPTAYPAVLDVNITNLGDFNHTFTVVAQPNVNLTPSNYSAYFQTYPALVNASVPAIPGAHVWANFSVPKAGVYQYFCEITGHFADGMYGYLYVGIPPPALPPPPSTALVETWILAGSAALLGIGLVLVLASAFTGRLGGPPSGRKSH